MTTSSTSVNGSSSFPWLVADIGGTNARFGWVADRTAEISDVRTLAVADHAGVAEAAHAYICGLPSGCRAERLQHAAFAVATPVSDHAEMSFTNNPWRFSRQGLMQALGLDDLLVLNDFEALGWSLPGLRDHQLRAHRSRPFGAGSLAVVGPGTGLGVAGLVRAPDGWVSVAGEGGHSTLAPANDLESDLLSLLRRHYGHVSAETVLSGTGLPRLHQALGELHGEAQEQLTASVIGERATVHRDARALRTVEVFCGMLGGFAGDVALIMGARGGLYIGGGVVPRWGDLFFRSSFRDRFVDKGNYRPYLDAIPTALITDTLVALAGVRAAMAQRLTTGGGDPHRHGL